MFRPKISNYLIVVIVFFIGTIFSLFPYSNWLYIALNHIGHSLIILSVFFSLIIRLNIRRFKGTIDSLENLFINKSGIFLEAPWLIEKNNARIVLKIDKKFYYQILFFLILTIILLYYVLIPIDLSLRDFLSNSFIITPAFILGILTAALTIMIFVVLYTLKRNKKVIIDKELKKIFVMQKKTPENINKSSIKNTFSVPLENLKFSRIEQNEYFQILVPTTGINGDQSFIESNTKGLPDDFFLLIQSGKEEFIRQLNEGLDTFLNE